MTEQQKSLLTQKWQLIIENVRAEDIIDYLIEVDVLLASVGVRTETL